MNKYTKVVGKLSNPLYIDGKEIFLGRKICRLTTKSISGWQDISSILSGHGTSLLSNVVLWNDELYFIVNGPKLCKFDGQEITDVLTLSSYLETNHDVNGATLVVHEDKLHCLGGDARRNSEYGRIHYIYDGTSWTAVKNSKNKLIKIPYAFMYGTAISYNGSIHIMCGGITAANMKKHYSWNGTAWKTEPSIPKSLVGYHHAHIHNDKLYIYGVEVKVTTGQYGTIQPPTSNSESFMYLYDCTNPKKKKLVLQYAPWAKIGIRLVENNNSTGIEFLDYYRGIYYYDLKFEPPYSSTLVHDNIPINTTSGGYLGFFDNVVDELIYYKGDLYLFNINLTNYQARKRVLVYSMRMEM